MKITGDDTSVELRLVGWESKREEGYQRGMTDWLKIQGLVTDASGPRDHHVSLDVEDALRIAPWLRDVAAANMPSRHEGGAGDTLLDFVEPGFAIDLVSRDQLAAVTHWYFYDPDGQEFELLAFDACVAIVSCTLADLLTCADAWSEELARLRGS